MRRWISAAAGAVLGVGLAAGPATAAPAQVIDSRACFVEEQADPPADVCVETRGVVKSTRAGDDLRQHSVLRTTSTSSRNGIVYLVVESRHVRHRHVRDGQEVLVSVRSHVTTTRDDAVCTRIFTSKTVHGRLVFSNDSETCT